MSIHKIHGHDLSIRVYGVSRDGDRDEIEWFAVEWLQANGVKFGDDGMVDDDHVNHLHVAARQGVLADWHDPTAVSIEVSPA